MQCKTYTQKDTGLFEHTDLALGGAKRHHESSDSNKYQTPVDSMHKINEEQQLAITSSSNAGWIQVKPKKGKKGRIET